MAMKALEDKILARVESSMDEIRQDLKKSIDKSNLQSDTASWMFRNIVAEQKELSSKVEQVSMEAFESRSDMVAQLEELSREALESRVDLLARTDEISCEALEARVDYCASFAELERRLDSGNAATDVVCIDAHLDSFAQAPELEFLEESKIHLNYLIEQFEDQAKTSNLIASLTNAVRSVSRDTTGQDIDVGQEVQEVVCPEKDQASNEKLSACELDLKVGEEAKSLEALPLQSLGMWQAEAIYSNKKKSAGNLYGSPTIAVSMPPYISIGKQCVANNSSFSVYRRRPVAHMASSQSMPLLVPLF
jgi:hypothetical protein